MYYRMGSGLMLRGWEGRSWVLVRRADHATRTLTREEFDALLLCDGETVIDDELLTPGIRDALDRLLRKNMIRPCDAPDPIDAEQRYRLYRNKYVESAFWSITGRCNYRCRHCFMDAPDAALGELSHEEAIGLIDQMADCGVLRVDITGGEPLVRSDFWQLMDRLAMHHIIVGMVYTNGWLLTERVLDEFERRGMRPEISISFDGVGWHDWMRGIEGAEEAALRALRLCQRRGFPTNVEMCLHKGNAHTLRETVRTLAEIGVPGIKVSNVAATPLWKAHAEGNVMSDQEYYDTMLAYLPHFFEDGMPINLTIASMMRLQKGSTAYRVFADGFSDPEKMLENHLCGAIRNSCYITPEGRLLPCMPMTASDRQNIFPLIRDIGLKNGLSDSFYMQYVNQRVCDLFAKNAQCNACPHKLQCGGGCRAEAFLGKDDDLMGCDYQRCWFYDNGYPQRIHEVADAAIARYAGEAAERSE